MNPELQELLLSDPRLLQAFLQTSARMKTDPQGRQYWDREPTFAADEITGMGAALNDENRVTAYLADRAMDAGLVRGTPEYLTAMSFTPIAGIPQGVEDIRLMGQDVIDQTRAGNYGTAAAEAALTAAMVVPSLLGVGPAVKAGARATRGLLDDSADFLVDESGALRLYHGSPHDFDRFDMSKIGTGEGAQAYGHGLYFAENEAVARGYRDQLSRDVFYDGSPVASVHPMDNPQAGAIHSVAKAVADGIPAEQAMAFEAGQWRTWADPYLRAAQENPQLAAEAARRAQSMTDIASAIEALDPQKFFKNPGRMYEVQINADPNDFLDWDKPLSEQPQNVREWFDSRGITPGFAGNQSGAELMMAERSLLGPEGAMVAMRDASIPGIKYFDHGSRFNALDGIAPQTQTRNYVVFDDSLIEILRKYGLLAPTAGLGAYALGQPTEAQAAPRGLLEDRR